MLPPKYLLNIANPLQAVLDKLELDILINIASCIEKENYINIAQYKTLISQTNRLYDEIIEETGGIIGDTAQMHYNDEIRRYGAIEKELQEFKQNAKVNNLLEATIQQTKGDLENLKKTIGVVVGDETFTLNEFYKHELNKHMILLKSGLVDRETINKQLINKLSTSGIRYIDYKELGKNYTVRSAVKMTVRTTANQLTEKISLLNANDLGQRYMKLTAHAGARPTHTVWQGEIVDLEGNDPDCVTLDDIGFGEVDGFMGANCRHNWYPYFKGITTNEFDDEYLKSLDEETIEYEDEEITYTKANEIKKDLERRSTVYNNRAEMFKTVGDKKNYQISKIKYLNIIEEIKKISKKINKKTKRFNEKWYNISDDINELKKKAFILSDSQFGKKASKHMKDYNLDVKSKEDRKTFKKMIYDIVNNHEKIINNVNWRGQDDLVTAYIKGEDAVLVNIDNEFITILKGGINNERVKNPRR